MAIDTTYHLSPEQQAIVADAMVDASMNNIPAKLKGHLIECQECRQAILEVVEIAQADIQYSGVGSSILPTESISKKQPTSTNPALWLAAASVILLLSFSGWIWSRATSLENQLVDLEKELNTVKQTQPLPVNALQSSKLTEQLNETVRLQQDSMQKLASQINSQKQLLAAAFTPNKDFEEQLNLSVRGGAVEINAPAKNAHLQTGHPIPFSWNQSGDASYSIILYNNNGWALHIKEGVQPDYSIAAKMLSPGTYYWKLIQEEEVVHLGKFTLDHSSTD